MIVAGRADPTPGAGDEAERQLELRYRQSAAAADAYAAADFTVVWQDVVLGPPLATIPALVRTRPLLVVVLCPRPDVVASRERGRAKTGYAAWTVAQLDAGLRGETPRFGLWLDSSDQTPEETVDEILRRAWTEGAVL